MNPVTEFNASRPDIAKSLSLVRWLAASWVVLLVVGYSSLRMPTALGARNFVSWDRAIFTTVNVATQTGFSQEFAKPDDFAQPVQWIFALQTLSGTLLSLVGGGVLLARVLDRPYTDSQIAGSGLLLMGIATLLGMLTWHDQDSLLRAGFRGLGALSCTGLVFGPLPRSGAVAFTGLLAPLSFVGSLGTLVLLELAAAFKNRQRMHEHAFKTLVLGAAVYFVGAIVLSTLFAIDGSKLAAATTRASGLVLTARGYGLPLEFADTWPRGIAWSLVVLILIGAGTAGAAGSLGIGWLLTLPSACWRTLHRMIFWQFAIIMAALLLLLQTEPQLAADRLILLVVSAGMNVGLSHEPVSITGWGLIILSLVMVAAKGFPLLFLSRLLTQEPQSI